jgi:hypothetical protein
MTGYLLNLARRSVGLAPVVHASVPLAATVQDAPFEALAETVAPRVDPPKPSGMTVGDVAQGPPVRAIEPPRVSAPAAIPIAPSAAPATVVQRLLATGVAPAAAPAPPIGPSAIAPVAAQVPAFVERAHIETGATPTAAARSPPAPSQLEPAARAPERVEPGTQPVPATPIAMPGEAARPEDRPAPLARDELHIVERVIESTRTESPAPIVASIRPAESLAEAAAVQHVEPVPERTVHVRIGAIEIYTADNATSASVASVLPAAAPAVPSAAPAGGFDDYVALRSYAPWTA